MHEGLVATIIIVAIAAMGAAVCTPFANEYGRYEVRREAVERGFAEWRVVDTGGATEFVWREPALEVAE